MNKLGTRAYRSFKTAVVMEKPVRQADPEFKAKLKVLRDGISGEDELRQTIQYWNSRFLQDPVQLNEFRAKQTVNCYPTRAKVDERNLEYLRGFEHAIHAPCSFPTKTWHVQSAKGKHLGSAGCIPREFYGSVGCLVKLTANLHNPWGSRAGLFNGAMGTEPSLIFSTSLARTLTPAEGMEFPVWCLLTSLTTVVPHYLAVVLP